MKTLLIVNPVAGHGKGKKCYKVLESRLRAEIPGLEIRFSDHAGRCIDIGRQAARARFERIICLGGDGTPFEVVNGLYSEGRPDIVPAIGIIPAGTGNSFLRDFGVSAPEAALDAILSGRSRRVDLVEFHYRDGGETARRYSLNIIGVGLIADILQLTNERLKFLGAAGYSLAVLARLAKGLDNRIAIKADGRGFEVRDSALVISNSKYTGGEMKIAPSADTADGRADYVLFKGVNRRDIISIFRGVFSGKHAAHPKVEMIQAAEFSIEADPPLRLMADGELLGRTPLSVKVLPGELTVLA